MNTVAGNSEKHINDGISISFPLLYYALPIEHSVKIQSYYYLYNIAPVKLNTIVVLKIL